MNKTTSFKARLLNLHYEVQHCFYLRLESDQCMEKAQNPHWKEFVCLLIDSGNIDLESK